MKITKLEHSGIALEKSGETLLCDPVEIQEKLPDFNNVVAIIITHKHGDHFQPEVIMKILAQNPNALAIPSTHQIYHLPKYFSSRFLPLGAKSKKFLNLSPPSAHKKSSPSTMPYSPTSANKLITTGYKTFAKNPTSDSTPSLWVNI